MCLKKWLWETLVVKIYSCSLFSLVEALGMIFVPGTKPCENKRKKIFFFYSMKRMESCPHIKHFVELCPRSEAFTLFFTQLMHLQTQNEEKECKPASLDATQQNSTQIINQSKLQHLAPPPVHQQQINYRWSMWIRPWERKSANCNWINSWFFFFLTMAINFTVNNLSKQLYPQQ